MMDGHTYSGGPHGLGASRETYAALLANHELSTAAPNLGDSYVFDGGGITLRPRDYFEIFYVAEDTDYIAFSLDSAAEVVSSFGAEDPKTVTVLPGRMHFHPAGQALYARYDGRSMQVVSVAVNRSLRSQIAEGMGLGEFRPPYGVNLQTPLTEALGRRLRDFMTNGRPGGEIVARSLAVVAVHEALAALADGPYHGGAPLEALEASPLRRALDFIEANIDRDITLNEIADVACKSPFHFARTFKSAIGTTPVAYVIERRIERSKELLTRTDLPISVIATRCGFNSQSHFCRTFRRLAERSPREFRRESVI